MTLLVNALSSSESEMGLSRNAKNKSARYFNCPSQSPSCILVVNSQRNTAICRSVRNPLPTCFSLISAASCSKHCLAVTVTNSSLRSAEARVTTTEKRGKEEYRELQKSLMRELLPCVLILRTIVLSSCTQYSTASPLSFKTANRQKRNSCTQP